MANKHNAETTIIAHLAKGTPVRVAGFRTPAVVHFYRTNKVTGKTLVSVRFTEVTDEITWAAGPGPFYLNVVPQRLTRATAE